MKISSVEYGNPHARERKTLQGTIDGARASYIKEIDGYASDLNGIERDWKRLLSSWKGKKIDDAAFTQKAKLLEARLKANTERRELAEGHREKLVAAQSKMIASYDAQLDDHFDRMRGLTAYMVGSGKAGPAATYLHNTLGDYKNATSREEKNGLAESISSILAADEFNTTADQAPSVLSDLERIEDPEQRTAFYRQNREQIHSAYSEAQLKALENEAENS